MSTYAAKNSFNVLIGKTGTFEALATVQITDPTLSTFIDDGQIIVLDSAGAVLTPGKTIADSPNIQLVQRSGATASTSKLVYSARIDGQNMYKYQGKAGSASQEQIYVLGYNGTSGSLDVSSANTFSLRITYTFDESMWSEQHNYNYIQYASATPTQVALANSFTTQMNYAKWPIGGVLIKSERLCNNAGATDGTATTITVVNGSDRATLNAGATTFVVGDYLRIGGGAVTDPMYKIVALSGTSVTLDTAYQGNSGAGVTIEYVTAALAAAADWGIKFTGLPLTWSLDPYGVFKYLKTTFLVQTVGLGSTIVTKTQEASVGNGIYELVAQMEAFAVGFEGAVNRTLTPLPRGRQDATSGVLYDTILLQYADASDISVISGTKPALQDLYIFLADGGAQSAILESQLNPWMASCPRAFNAVTV